MPFWHCYYANVLEFLRSYFCYEFVFESMTLCAFLALNKAVIMRTCEFLRTWLLCSLLRRRYPPRLFWQTPPTFSRASGPAVYKRESKHMRRWKGSVSFRYLTNRAVDILVIEEMRMFHEPLAKRSQFLPTLAWQESEIERWFALNL